MQPIIPTIPTIISYPLAEIIPYINWVYFFHAWKMSSKTSEGRELQTEALQLLHNKEPLFQAQVLFALFSCNSDGDDIIIYPSARLSFLRQLQPSTDGYCWCLSDFVKPLQSQQQDSIGIFAATANPLAPSEDIYQQLLQQTLSSRLAEAALEKAHEDIRKNTNLWGYAPREDLTIPELHAEKFQGIRPAVGYPCLPDQKLIFKLDSLINFSAIGISLTETGGMIPQSSVCGLMFSHSKAHYFAVGKTSAEQLADYQHRLQQ